jgi:hypothetical protein
MTPEQWAMITAVVVGTVVALFVAVTKLINTLYEYLDRMADQKIEEKAQKLVLERLDSETEIQERKSEADARRRQDLALAETIERVLVMYSQSQDVHAKETARGTDVQERNIEVLSKLTTSFDNQTRALMTSQSWNESRSNDYLVEIGLMNERTAGLVKTAGDTHAKVDTITGGLEQVKTKLDSLLSEVTKLNPNTEAIQRLETEITNLIVLVKPLRDAIFRDANTVIPPPENLIDTKELTAEDMLAATRVFPDESETENPTKLSNEPDSQPNLPKASGL